MFFDRIADGLSLLLAPMPLFWLVAGLCLGFVVGVLPGLSTSNTAALLLPFSVGLPTESALILIVSIYAGAQFGGAVPAILVNVPGEAGSAVTALDGYPMTKKGQGGVAIGLARTASALGGVLSGLVILLIIGPLGDFALKFGAREIFVVVVLALLVTSTLIGDNVRKGVLAGLLGLLLATVGGSPLSGQYRFSFGSLDLYEGIQFIPALIGLFAVSEMLLLVVRRGRARAPVAPAGMFRTDLRDAGRGVTETLRRPATLVQGTVVGTVLGVIPGIGTGVSNFISYGIAKRRSRHPERFGTGAPEGVIASESCDNAVTSATMVPTFALGIPGSATMAVVLAQLYVQGVQPGPRVMTSHAGEVFAAVLALIVASLLILPLGILLSAPLVSITRVPLRYLVPAVLVVAFAGAFAARYAMFDVGIAAGFGLLGLLMRLNGYPVIPLVLGLILGPLAEENLMRSLALGNNSIGYLFGSPTALVLWGLVVAAIAYLVVGARRKREVSSSSSVMEP